MPRAEKEKSETAIKPAILFLVTFLVMKKTKMEEKICIINIKTRPELTDNPKVKNPETEAQMEINIHPAGA